MEQNLIKTILIVEDDNIQLKVLTNAFVENNFQVIGAVNGQEGLENALNASVDVILLDRVMPIMDGITMMQALRKVESSDKKIPIILFTNLPVDDIAKKSIIAAGENPDYILKSECSLGEIVQKVREKICY